MLPDVALLEIFYFYVDEARIDAWYTLVHVCRKWRDIVFGSPRRLNLRLYCRATTPVIKTLDVWPLLPIVIWVYGHELSGVDNVVAALEHNNCISRIDLFNVSSSQLENILPAMQKPFPELTRLDLQLSGETAPVISANSASFLGGSAPRLQTLILSGIPFPGLPKLLLSATQLVDLDLGRIPDFGYISPMEMVTCLSVLTKLERLLIGFESPCRPDIQSRHLPLSKRILLPVLTELWFKGVGEYLEDLVAQINTPLLENLWITFFNQLIFDTPQLTQFIGRTPKFKAHDEARVVFSDLDVSVTLLQTFGAVIKLGISCSQSDWLLSSLAQVCSLSFPPALIPAVENLYILKFGSREWQQEIENCQWLELLHPFTAVKDVYLASEFTPRIAPVLQELVGERVTEVLPALRSLFFEETLPSGPDQKTIEQFVTARRLANHPVAISCWKRK